MKRRKVLPSQVVKRVREAARFRCGYCLAQQRYLTVRLEIDHVRPLAKGGTDEESNLWLACSICNGHKSDKTTGIDPETGNAEPLFNPRLQVWSEHFAWEADQVHLRGLTPTGRATVAALHLNDDADALIARMNWVSVGWHPPKDELRPDTDPLK